MNTFIIILVMFIFGLVTAFLMIRDEINCGNDVHFGEALFVSVICMAFGVFLLPMYICIFYIYPAIEILFTNKVLFKGRKDEKE